MKQPKYQYHVQTWGGFYNKEYKDIHGLEDGDFIFDTNKERDNFMKERRLIEEELDARYLVFSCTEGYCCDIRTVLHRVIRYKGATYYSNYDIGINYPFDDAKFFMQYKWCAGFNDYPLGEDFDYSKVKVVKEWITGAHQEIKYNETSII